MNGNSDNVSDNVLEIRDSDAKEEIDLLGLLFEKYVDGAEYDREKGTVSIPKEAINRQ